MLVDRLYSLLKTSTLFGLVQDLFHTFNIAWDIKNDFAYVLQFFSLIFDSVWVVCSIRIKSRQISQEQKVKCNFRMILAPLIMVQTVCTLSLACTIFCIIEHFSANKAFAQLGMALWQKLPNFVQKLNCLCSFKGTDI